MTSRRHFLAGGGLALAGASLVNKATASSIPEAPQQSSAATMPPLAPPNGRPYNPVVTLNGWTLPWRMKDGVKEFHLVAEPVVREIAPGMKANLWGYNGQSPGPTIEVVEGDRVRVYVTNKLPEVTSIHWHGQILPNGMDGVAGLTQPPIAPGKTYVYEFVARYPGTFMYHPHSDEMTQMAMGMMGFWVTHPKDPRKHAVDRDFVFLLNAYDIDPGSYTPNVNTMLDFNLWTINSRAFPGVDPMVVRKDDRVRIRMGNLTMTNHPFHIHGHRFEVTGTDGGFIPPAARWPEVTVDIGVGQMRAIEFVADNPGDWAFHCHKTHHTMNAMGHGVRTLIGVDQSGVANKINDLVPGYMVMGDKGGSMGNMKMPLPENTLPMMDGRGPFGNIDMGGMFSVIKVREGLARGDYRDPGWYRHPEGTVAREWTGPVPETPRASSGAAGVDESAVTVRRGGGHMGH
jgi:FtsP/CotA-like multicopper oxidase with cupredoxin domain